MLSSPFFYIISAFVGKSMLLLGVPDAYLPKILQSLSCLYVIMHLAVIYLILKKLPLQNFSKTIAFATVCFLPQHIYISAMNSNDTISYLSVALCLYLNLIALERKLALPWLISLSIVVTLALFTKYTVIAILPARVIGLAIMGFRRMLVSVRKMIISIAVILLLPLTCLGIYGALNLRNYGDALPWNRAILNASITQRKAEKIDFF